MKLKRQKNMLRKKAYAARARLSPAAVAAKSARIAERVLGLAAFRRAQVVATYLALADEVQTAPLIAACHAARKRVCTPVFDAVTKSYRFAWLTPRTKLRAAHFGVLEPVRPRRVAAPARIELALVPGVAFDRAGHRLGHGRGYFDQLLAGLAACKVGLAFAAQVVARVPHAAHDVRMDAVVTEGKVFQGLEKIRPDFPSLGQPARCWRGTT